MQLVLRHGPGFGQVAHHGPKRLRDAIQRDLAIVVLGFDDVQIRGGQEGRCESPALRALCEQRFNEFGTAGNASKIRPLPLSAMAASVERLVDEVRFCAAPVQAARHSFSCDSPPIIDENAKPLSIASQKACSTTLYTSSQTYARAAMVIPSS